MGLWDIFKGKGPSSDAIAKQVGKIKEHYAQPDYRRMAMDQLLKWDTDESLRAILERFCVVVQSPHWDEEEKKWLTEEIVSIGARMKPILRQFILEKNELNHALQAYRQIASQEEYIDMLTEALKRRPPSDHRSVQGKQEILAALSELNLRSLDELFPPYLDDHSDDVQCLAIEALAKSDSAESHEKLLPLLGSETHSARVVRTAAQSVSKLELALDPSFKLSTAVSEDYKIDKGLLVRL